MVREYLIRFLKKMYKLKGKEYIDELLTLRTITKEEYDQILSL